MWTLEDLSNTERQSPEIIIISTVHDYLCGLFASIAYLKRGCVLNRVESTTIHKNKAYVLSSLQRELLVTVWQTGEIFGKVSK